METLMDKVVSSEQLLGELPSEHPLRNAPLVSIAAETRWVKGSQWKRVEPYWKIANVTFNDLGIAWTECWLWRATKPEMSTT